MVDGLIGFRVLQDNIQIIAKNKVKVEWLVGKQYKTFIQIGNIVYPPEKADASLQNCTCLFVQFSWATEYNKLRLQMFKKNESAPEKLHPRIVVLMRCKQVHGWHIFVQGTGFIFHWDV